MTRFAFGGKCGFVSGKCCASSAASALNKPGLSKEPSAAAPMPVAVRPKKWRRLINNCFSRIGSISIFRNRLVQVQKQVGRGGPRCEFGMVEFRFGLEGPNSKQLLRSFAVLLIIGELLLEQVEQHFRFVLR